MAKAVGLLVDKGRVKAAEITGSARRMRIKRILSDNFPAGDGEAVAEGLKDFAHPRMYFPHKPDAYVPAFRKHEGQARSNGDPNRQRGKVIDAKEGIV